VGNTQVARILAWLSQHDGLCAMTPLDWHPRIYRVAARIFDLKEMGYAIQTNNRCPIHDNADHAYYRLDSMGRLF
jgi:hypothetical protein